eukprot:357121-Chlamydomonas_euryale.AAC.4
MSVDRRRECTRRGEGEEVRHGFGGGLSGRWLEKLRNTNNSYCAAPHVVGSVAAVRWNARAFAHRSHGTRLPGAASQPALRLPEANSTAALICVVVLAGYSGGRAERAARDACAYSVRLAVSPFLPCLPLSLLASRCPPAPSGFRQMA